MNKLLSGNQDASSSTARLVTRIREPQQANLSFCHITVGHKRVQTMLDTSADKENVPPASYAQPPISKGKGARRPLQDISPAPDSTTSGWIRSDNTSTVEAMKQDNSERSPSPTPQPKKNFRRPRSTKIGHMR